MKARLQFMLLTVLLYFLALSVHEAAHLVVLKILGGDGRLIISPWDFYFVKFRTYGLHLEITSPPTLKYGITLVNLFGPLIAAFFLVILSCYAGSKALRSALYANIAISLGFAVIESLYAYGDALYEASGKNALILLGLNALTKPEINLGMILFLGFLGAKYLPAKFRKFHPASNHI